MSTPSQKNIPVRNFLDKVSKELYGITKTDAIYSDVCVMCNAPASENTFRDALSKLEYTISGMCQKCQDSVFGE